MLEPADLRKLIDSAGVPLRAMILLGLNCGFGNGDCAGLPIQALDLERGWIHYPRPKTSIARRCPLWPATIEALRAAIAERPETTSDLVFLTSRGNAFIHTSAKSHKDRITIQFRKLLAGLGIHRERVSFYLLRHVFRTAADVARDRVATDIIMGHADRSMAGEYIERVDDDRLRAVVRVVREWMEGGAA